MFTRRSFMAACAGAGAYCFCGRSLTAANTAVATYTYKKVGDLEIKADVHRPDDSSVCPVVVWIHAGALIVGHREWILGRMLEGLLARKYAIVSIDYRLAPETKLPEIIADLEDAFRWIRAEAAGLARLDASQIAVLGASAGGYLTLTAGYRVLPRVKALVSYYGYGDLIGDWLSQPSPHPRHYDRPGITREEAYRHVAGLPVSDSRDRRGDGNAFYEYCRQQGAWPREVSGWDPRTEPEKFYPYMPVKNVTADYPPTLLIHGTEDTDVPYDQSVVMAEQLKRRAVVHELVTIPSAEHGLDGGDRRQVEAADEKALQWVDRHLH